MEDIEHLHKLFRNEVTTASWSFFVWKSINNIASDNKKIYNALGGNALSWSIITHSLQSNFFVTLGRLFDISGDAFSIHSFLRACIDNIDQFSIDALRERKLRGINGKEPDWLNEYLKEAYVPSEKDFQRLKGETSKYQKDYEAIYRPIRNKLIAHKEKQTMENVNELFGKTNISQIEDFLSFLYQIENIVSDLLFNGRLAGIGHYTFKEEDFVAKDISSLLAKLT